MFRGILITCVYCCVTKKYEARISTSRGSIASAIIVVVIPSLCSFSGDTSHMPGTDKGYHVSPNTPFPFLPLNDGIRKQNESSFPGIPGSLRHNSWFFMCLLPLRNASVTVNRTYVWSLTAWAPSWKPGEYVVGSQDSQDKQTIPASTPSNGSGFPILHARFP
jgi:hypothetical protein